VRLPFVAVAAGRAVAIICFLVFGFSLAVVVLVVVASVRRVQMALISSPRRLRNSDTVCLRSSLV
jgi:hypothetical protein